MSSTLLDEEVDTTAGRLNARTKATLLGLASAIAYTAANVCLRSVTDVNPVWVSCIKAVPTFLGVLPFLILRVSRTQSLFPSWKLFAIILTTGLVGQIVGNVAFQWALGIIGLALNVPITMGTMIVSGAFLGKWILKDPLTTRMVRAGTILILGICVLAFGAEEAQTVLSQEMEQDRGVSVSGVENGSQFWRTAAGLGAAGSCGIAYCLLSIGIRFATNQGTPQLPILGVVSLSGLIGLGLISFVHQGVSNSFDCSTDAYIWMLLAGFFNFIAFMALTKSLHLATVFFVNALNASQIAMAAIVGIILFNEPPTFYLVFGIGLLTGGLLLMKNKKIAKANKGLSQKRV